MRLDQRRCYGSQTGPMTWICVKTQDSLLLLGCLEARKEANQRTVYGSAKRTGIKTNHKGETDGIRWVLLALVLEAAISLPAFSSPKNYPDSAVESNDSF
jgi:hypothetical protein